MGVDGQGAIVVGGGEELDGEMPGGHVIWWLLDGAGEDLEGAGG